LTVWGVAFDGWLLSEEIAGQARNDGNGVAVIASDGMITHTGQSQHLCQDRHSLSAFY